MNNGPNGPFQYLTNSGAIFKPQQFSHIESQSGKVVNMTALRLQQSRAPGILDVDVSSDQILPIVGNMIRIQGTGDLTSLDPQGSILPGTVVYLVSESGGSITVRHNTGDNQFRLNNGGDFVLTGQGVLTLLRSLNAWQEVSRSSNN